MKRLILATSLTVAFATAGDAQPTPFNCQNDPVRIDIPAQTLPRALDVLGQQTNCPISRDVDVSRLRGNAVKGRMSPADALVALVRGTGIEAHTVRQGLAIDRIEQQEIAKRSEALDQRIRTQKASGHLSSSKAASLSRQIATVRRQAATYARQQGFVSAAEKASFQRTFQQVSAAIRT